VFPAYLAAAFFLVQLLSSLCRCFPQTQHHNSVPRGPDCIQRAEHPAKKQDSISVFCKSLTILGTLSLTGLTAFALNNAAKTNNLHDVHTNPFGITAITSKNEVSVELIYLVLYVCL
jgi:hypothetical protein